MFKLILKKAAPIPKFESFESFLFVSPHPDDSEVGCAATIAKLTSEGKKVFLLIVTDGGVGSVVPSLCGEQLIDERKKEVISACEVTGVPSQNVTFLNFPDGGDYDPSSMRYAIADVLVKIRPDVVVIPDHTVRTESHIDHINVGRETTYAAVCVAPFAAACAKHGLDGTYNAKLLAYYYTDSPNGYVDVSKHFCVVTKALEQYKSQFSEQDLKQVGMYRRIRAMRFGFRRFCRYADGYRLAPPLHWHCFPEAAEFLK